jgi:hypothetical protein
MASGKSVQKHDEGFDKDFDKKFLDFLNNKNKKRKRGFLVLVRKPQSLEVLQKLCLDRNKQTWNNCITFRFHLEYPPVFAPLLVALSLFINSKYQSKIDNKIIDDESENKANDGLDKKVDAQVGPYNQDDFSSLLNDQGYFILKTVFSVSKPNLQNRSA